MFLGWTFWIEGYSILQAFGGTDVVKEQKEQSEQSLELLLFDQVQIMYFSWKPVLSRDYFLGTNPNFRRHKSCIIDTDS
jgi:hypothetical protein